MNTAPGVVTPLCVLRSKLAGEVPLNGAEIQWHRELTSASRCVRCMSSLWAEDELSQRMVICGLMAASGACFLRELSAI